jgi:ABC-type dipeptide/oligopeptide/nickel transport system permease component
MRFLSYLGRRALFFLPQIVGILLVTFIFVRMIPGDPAKLMAGPLMPEEGVELIRERMGLNKPLPIQFFYYIRNVAHGDLGVSWYTGNPVMDDIRVRLPATIELLGLALLATFLIMLPIAIKSASMGKGVVQRVSRKVFYGYGMAASAFPDFWLGLILIFIFYAALGWAPAPVGQLDIQLSAPTRITGMYLVDGLLTGNWPVFISSLTHLILPVFVLTFVYGGVICKMAIVTATEVQNSEHINFAKVSGLPVSKIEGYVTRAVYPPVATITAVTWAFLIGGAVLVETVFSWGGFGQYAVQSIINSDFAAIQGVVLISALLNLIIYILVDMIYFWVDPRIKSLG